MSDEGARQKRRSYRPAVEALEALRLFSGLTAAPIAVPAAHGPLPANDDGGSGWPLVAPPVDSDAWDAALAQTQSSGLFADTGSTEAADPEAIRRGLLQLDRYLARTWARAGLPSHKHDDCTQAVYVSLLSTFGRDGFDALTADVGRNGIREVLSRETAEGPDFFRAIDATKKRAQRERNLHSLDDGASDPSAPVRDGDWSEAIGQAIDRSLSPREAELIRSTMAGETPAEIAARWGVAPKTVSNEKTRALNKLRSFLVAEDPLLMAS